MSKLIFTPQDFRTSPENPFYDSSLISIESIVKKANKLFDDWLAREGTVVYGTSTGRQLWSLDKDEGDDEKALLIQIESLEKKCEHFFIDTKEHNDTKYNVIKTYLLKCHDCGKYLRPKDGWEEA